MYAILRTKKLGSSGSVGGSSMHATRERETPNSDPTMRPSNRVIFGAGDPAAEIERRIKELQEKEGMHVRKDGVRAIELMMTASPKFFDSPKKVQAFVNESMKWLKSYFGEENIASAILHLDETTPHLSVFVLPLDRTPRTKGKSVRLNAKKWCGGRAKMAAMQTSFAKQMEPLGLKRGVEKSRAKHTTIKEYYGLIKNVDEKIKEQIPLREKIIAEQKKVDESIQMAELAILQKEKRIAKAKEMLAKRIIQPGQTAQGLMLDAVIGVEGRRYRVISDGKQEWYVQDHQNLGTMVGQLVKVARSEKGWSVGKVIEMKKDKNIKQI